MKTVRIEYSRMATVICSRALGRRPTTAVMVRRPPMMTMAAARELVVGRDADEAEHARADGDHVDEDEAPKAMSISQPS